MAITRSNGAIWGTGDPLTAAQINAVDINVTNALDKRSGQTDILGSVVTATSAGRVIPAFLNNSSTDSNQTITVGTGNQFIRVATLTATRTYTFSNAGAANGDSITVWNENASFSVIVKDASTATLIQLGLGASNDDDAPFATFVFLNSKWNLLHNPNGSRTHSQSFTSNGTWTCPRGVFFATLYGWGGGGGGGGGFSWHTANGFPGGGGGGGGSLPQYVVVPVVPGNTYAITIGTGGAGGAGSIAGITPGFGSDGSDTTFGSLARFVAASGAYRGDILDATTFTSGGLSAGGGAVVNAKSNVLLQFRNSAGIEPFTYIASPGNGGFGQIGNPVSGSSGFSTSVFSGSGSLNNFSGGGSGLPGLDSGSFKGGGNGGGGGGGTGGAGGPGGAGGDANNAGIGAPGAIGGAAGANSGAGGGGGGSAGSGTSYGPGGGGGAGGSGFLRVSWVK